MVPLQRRPCGVCVCVCGGGVTGLQSPSWLAMQLVQPSVSSGFRRSHFGAWNVLHDRHGYE